MSDIDLSLVEYEDRDPNNGNHLVTRVSDGEKLSVPSSSSAILLLNLEKGQKLLLFWPKELPYGYLITPI